MKPSRHRTPTAAAIRSLAILPLTAAGLGLAAAALSGCATPAGNAPVSGNTPAPGDATMSGSTRPAATPATGAPGQTPGTRRTNDNAY